jgi:cytochrome d ubiquinol oxidase subunit I
MLLRVLSLMTYSGWVAVLAGWYVSEVGRQPWMIYGQLRIDEVVAAHGGGTVLTTLLAYAALYVFLLVSYIATLRVLSLKPAQSLVEGNASEAPQGGYSHG